MSNIENISYNSKEKKLSRIQALLEKGEAIEAIGNPSDKDVFCFTTWTRTHPREHLLSYVNISHYINPAKKMLVLVDDVISREYFERSSEAQQIYTREYQDFFESTGKASVILSSDLLSGINFSNNIVSIGKNISLNTFVSMLPESKRNQVSLGMHEMIHALHNLIVLQQMAQLSQTIIAGSGSRAIITTHRNISDNSLSALFLPSTLLTAT